MKTILDLYLRVFRRVSHVVDKSCGDGQNTLFIFSFFFEIGAVHEIMSENTGCIVAFPLLKFVTRTLHNSTLCVLGLSWCNCIRLVLESYLAVSLYVDWDFFVLFMSSELLSG